MRILRTLPMVFGMAVATVRPALSEILPTARALADISGLLYGERQDAVRRSALQMAALASEGRLLPSDLSAARTAGLEDAVLGHATSPEARRALLATLPPADLLVFTGRRLAGGNFRHIDALIGTDRLPVAMDRRLPAFLIPLSADEADRLASENVDDGAAKEAADVYGEAARNFVADGLAVRTYAGRMDDLYFHLVQEGTPAGKVEFFAIASSLPGRAYDPLTGAGSSGTTPTARFDLDDIFSRGGFAAVQRFRGRNPGRLIRNPFSTFALKLLPFAVLHMREWSPGGEIVLTRDAIRSAIAEPRRLSPSPVLPLFQDRSRFLGRRDMGRVTRVVNRPDLTGEIAAVEGDLVLPDDPENPVANELLAQSPPGEWLADGDPDAIAPDPPDFDAEVAADSMDLPEIGDEAAESFATPTPPEDFDAQEDSLPAPPRPAVSPFRVAVLLPTLEESRHYLGEIAKSDARLTGITAELRRISCFRQWLQEALNAIEGTLANGDAAESAAQRLANVASVIRTELALQTVRAKQLTADRLSELETRGAMRTALEEKVKEDRGELLRQLTGTAA